VIQQGAGHASPKRTSEVVSGIKLKIRVRLAPLTTGAVVTKSMRQRSDAGSHDRVRRLGNSPRLSHRFPVLALNIRVRHCSEKLALTFDRSAYDGRDW
jgi:hypothetical protein